ncbi:MAG: hypothetical protein ACPLRH_00020 [Desulfotomaculales bacterium]
MKCKACGAEIEFVRTPAGKLMPVEAGYLTVITDDGKVVRGRAPHWAACPAAKKFRKGDNNANRTPEAR